MKPRALAVILNCMDMNEEKQMALQNFRDILPFTTTWIIMNFEAYAIK